MVDSVECAELRSDLRVGPQQLTADEQQDVHKALARARDN